MENKFKAGDFARRKSDGRIVKINVAEYGWVAYDEERLMTGACPMEEVELIDHKTAFLSELKGLLEKFDAHLIAHKTNIPVSVYFNGEDKPCVAIGKEVNKGCGVVITSDNIMDYDKE